MVDEGGLKRQVNVFEPMGGFVSLRTVRNVFPDGLETKDLAWILRRILVSIGYAHSKNLINGSVTPDNVMILPEQHGLILSSWTASFPLAKKHLLVVDNNATEFYPTMVSDEVDTGIDIFMGMKVAEFLAEKDAPKEVRKFLEKYTGYIKNEHLDAWETLREFDEIIEKLYGPRKFKPFIMPKTA